MIFKIVETSCHITNYKMFIFRQNSGVFEVIQHCTRLWVVNKKVCKVFMNSNNSGDIVLSIIVEKIKLKDKRLLTKLSFLSTSKQLKFSEPTTFTRHEILNHKIYKQ